MKVIAATLIYNTPELADAMRRQITDVQIIDNGSTPALMDADVRQGNLGFVRGWNEYMRTVNADYVWMLNSDVEGVNDNMMQVLARNAQVFGMAAITPAFNSPHALFHSRPHEPHIPRLVSWADWTCPLVSVKAWRDLVGFDEQSSGYFADVDWSHRAHLRGEVLGVCDWLQVHHLGSKTALQVGHVWDANDEWLRHKWGVDSWVRLT
jgi:GT2 family glycosyltransferase